MRIAITNLRKYNEGELEYKWIELGIDDIEEIEQQINDFLGEDEEYFISDYEAPVTIGKYEDLEDLNWLAELIEDSGLSIDEIKNLNDQLSNNKELAEVLEEGDYMIIEDVRTQEDLGKALVYDYDFFNDVPDYAKNYLDFEHIGKEYSRFIDYPFHIKNGYAIQVNR